MNYKNYITEKINLDGVSKDEIQNSITICDNLEHGDFSLACFKFSKELRLSPVVIAEKVKASFEIDDMISEVSVISGYVNFKLNRKNFIKTALSAAIKKGEIFKNKKANKKTVCIDYSSINIAKPFHIGHLLTTAIGGSLYKIYKYLGYSVVGINHLGDWGTQFGKLVSAYKKWGDKKTIDKGGIAAINALYVKWHNEAESDKELEKEGRYYFKKIEDGDKEALEIFEWFKKITLTEVKKVYDKLGVEFDSYNGESFYNDKMGVVVDELKSKKLLNQSDGASVVDLEKFDMPPCLVLKSDGTSLYATRDLAAAIWRKNNYKFDKNLYVVAYQQNLHFKQVFKVLELMGKDWANDCVHVPFGMVSLEGGASLSTRKGNVVYLSEVLDTAVKKTLDIINEKNASLKNKQEIANSVGIGSVVFMALANSRIKDIVFSYDRALNFDGETAPYIQYTHARCNSILEKAQNQPVGATALGFPRLPDNLLNDDAFSLIKLIDRYDDIVELAAIKYEPSIISKYLIDISQQFNKYYTNYKIAGDKNRLKLTTLVKNTIKNALALLLIKAPDKM